jgi:adenylate cyclase
METVYSPADYWYVVRVKWARNIYLAATLAILAVIVGYYLQTSLLEGFEDRTYDLRVRAFGSATRYVDKVAVIAIDDKTIGELGRFPFSREHYAGLLDVTTKAGARAVLFDAFFPEAQSPAVDQAFAAAVRRAGNVTLSGGLEFAPDGTVAGFTANIPPLQKAARRIAQINVLPDSDGVIRWTRLMIPYQGVNYPSLGLSGAAELLGSDDLSLRGETLRVGPVVVPTDREQRLLISYPGPPGTYARYSFVDVLKGRVDRQLLRDKVLFVGATALGIYDMRITPYSNNTPGVEINAVVADGVASGSFRTRGPAEGLIDLVSIIVLGGVTCLVTWRLRHAVSLPLVCVMACSWVALACGTFVAGRWVSIVYPVLSILVTYAVTAYLRFFIVDRQARDIRAMFSSYVSKRVVDELVKNPEMARIGGESRELTILFADVKNYTTYSESRSPAEVVRILNDYLAAMTDIIIRHDGTLDKFLGDGILAYWNAPLPQQDHVELAARCALEMMAAMGPLQEKWRRAGDEPLTWGIGINTGEVIVGNMGAVGKKMEYTAIGDNVNLTYRIQDKSRDAGCAVVTRAFRDRVDHLAVTEPLGEIMVKGKKLPIEVFALTGLKQGSRNEGTR